MARFLIIGALAWDRPVWLSGPLASGARLSGRTKDARFGGRLGGGAANAAAALARAGHTAMVASVVEEDDVGEHILEAALARGIDVSLVRRRKGATKTTLLLIEPNGERVILGLDWAAREELANPLITPEEVAAFAPDAVFVRAAYPGAFEALEGCPALRVAHAPARRDAVLDADVVIASRDDAGEAAYVDPFAAARRVSTSRLRWGIVTAGAQGAVASDPRRIIRAPGLPVPVVDATGAGDVFSAGLMEALAAGADMEAALAHACVWGAAAVGFEGSAAAEGDAVFAPFSAAGSASPGSGST